MSDTPGTDDDYIVVDVEGNGGRPPDLVELAVVSVSAGTSGEPISWLVRPVEPIAWQARKVHGISNDDVASQPMFDAVRDDVLEHLNGAIVVGHNVKIDLDVLRRKLPGWEPSRTLDTLRLARVLAPGLRSYSLSALVAHYNLDENIPPGLKPHRAAYDALVTARLLVALGTRPDGSTRSATELRDPISVTATTEQTLF